MNDGRRAVSISYDSTLRIWNFTTGKEEKKIDLSRLVSGLAVSPDDKVAAIGFSTEEGIVELWSLESGLRIGHLEGHNDRVSELKFSADGNRLMTSCWDMSVRTWDVESSKMIREFKNSNPDSASLSPDGRMVAARDPDNKLIAQVWNAETGAVIQSLNLGEAGWLLRTAFTSDSRQLVTGSSRGEVQLWDLSNGKELNRFDVHDGAMFHLGLTPDDRHLVTSGRDNALRLWNLRTGKQLGETTAITRRFRRLAISRDGRHVVTGGGSLWSEITQKNESDGDYDVHLYRLPESVWPKGDSLPKPGTVRSFGPAEKLITQDGVTTEDAGWRNEAKQNRTVRLFEVPKPGVEDCMLTYRAKIKTEGIEGRAYLEMWCRVAGFGESFSKGFQNAVSGTTGWASYEIPFFLKKGQRPDLIKLNLVIEGKGTVWIKDIELLKSPLPDQAEAADKQKAKS